MNPDLFKDSGWTVDRDPPELTKFRDNTVDNSTCTEGVNNTIKGRDIETLLVKSDGKGNIASLMVY